MKCVESKLLQERYYQTVLPNGLQMVVMPRTGMQQTYVSMTLRYGSAHRHAVLLKNGEEMIIPDGVQHFLEHMIFARPDGKNAHSLFQKRGASISAYTTHAITSYQFFCTEQLEENIVDLLEMVQSPYFSAHAVDAERRIIEQEIQMYAQDESSLVQSALFRGLYGEDHPLATDVLGTIESIRAINSELLQCCHELFYHPQNSVLLIIGDVNPEYLFPFVTNHQANKTFGEWQLACLSLLPGLDQSPVSHAYCEQQAPIDVPIVSLGFKWSRQGHVFEKLLYLEQATQLAFQAVLGPCSRFYQELVAEELIEGELFIQTDLTDQYGHVWLAVYTSNPIVLQQRIQSALQHAVTSGMEQVSFEAARTASLVQHVRDYDDLFALGPRVSYQVARGFDEFELYQFLSDLTPAMATEALQQVGCADRCSWSLLLPHEE